MDIQILLLRIISFIVIPATEKGFSAKPCVEAAFEFLGRGLEAVRLFLVGLSF
jgi:hypothetical protein